ncbi:hypothetical protein Back2_05470 [Nocardioides baekrokdamisoli]|uniref:Tryptophan-associated transmembrane protein n=1 Tax=Nocardioides baekrokdamisoli TaxID=1804624 RepID=A0A3G9IBL9_9ACTN|nr:hypothetical protein Back2_05470 [Nocardioides baekrokdamisoli]
MVLLGVAASGLAAYAGSKDWISSHAVTGASTLMTSQNDDLTSPGTTSLALVALAAWGVLLVTRGWARRTVAILAGIAALGPIPGLWGSAHHLTTSHEGSHATGWPWVAAVSLVLAATAAVLAAIWAPSWPEMGRKYDAPQAPAGIDTDDNAGLWRQLSEGRDPTEDGNP